ncbi:ComEC/Rec2 family competence protein [Nocardioides sp. LS1]|uniref:ComEC/Rec2 family competence protein n=1 Tax=Nocardioides sp. LS1 TaxID=1027620 RepID=UPI000FF9C2EE|nr:ComEC/Rec2 family competence protein [Nocardioides sp. LS1]GCD88412.1 membrane protein [Nocardioides sp. LS1]
MPSTSPAVADLRMPVLGVAAWLGALTALAPGQVLAAGVAALVALGCWAAVRRRPGVAVAVLVAGAVCCSGLVRHTQVDESPVALLARDGAAARLELTVLSDPHVLSGRYGDRVLVRGEVRHVDARGSAWTLAVPVLVLGDTSWGDVRLGSTVAASGLLAPSDGGDAAAVLSARGPPRVLAGPDAWWRGAEAVRASLRASVAGRPADQRALVPALVDGDDAGLDPAVADDFRTTGLTHLLAVSGTNLTLVVGFLLVVARWCRVRGRWLLLVGALGIVGFVLLARTEPSVLRAAVMGSVALVGLGRDARQRGGRALGAAVVGLLLVDPALAAEAGFALSVLATAGILFLAPGWRDALARWLPRWLAEAVAVPAAAQLACTPLVAAISGQVSLVAVGANLLAAPAVGPATVLGLTGGLLGLLWGPLGTMAGTPAAWCVGWIVAVARHGAALPTAAVLWGSGVLSLALLTVLTLLVALLAPAVLRHRVTGAASCLLLVVVVLVRPPTPGWPPAGWVLVVCDVGQGDALAVRAGPHAAVVIDAGPDPVLVDRCLDRLGITEVPLLVLTHFHADHVDGITGVLDGRRVGAIWTTRLQDPPYGVEEVGAAAETVGLVPTPAPYAASADVGDVHLQVVWPLPDSPTTGPGDGSTANEASVVMVAEVHGVRMLLSGDVEPEGQAELARELPGLRVDVLKVPHHGSRYQDLDFLASLGARLAVVSVGADNDYGHPASSTIAGLASTGARVLRTDQDGDVAVVARDGDLLAVTSG